MDCSAAVDAASRCSTRSIAWPDGKHLRPLPLLERKRLLRPSSPSNPPSYSAHQATIDRSGIEFFRLTCEQDLEGIVAKLKLGRYGQGWFKTGTHNIRSVKAEVSYSKGVEPHNFTDRLRRCRSHLPPAIRRTRDIGDE